MNSTRVPITPEKHVQLRSNTPSDWPVNQMRRTYYQEIPVPGSNYIEKLLHYPVPNQNLHLIGQTGQTGGNKALDGSFMERNSVLDHIQGFYNQSWHYESNGSNSISLELQLKKNTTNIASASRNLDASNNMAARNPQPSKFYPQASSDVSDPYAGLERCNIHSGSGIMIKEANRLLFPNRISEFGDSNPNSFLSLLNSDIHCSDPNQLEGFFSEIPYGDPYHNYNLNYVPIAEVDATASFTNSLQSVPKMTDQLKFVDNQFSIIPDYITAESTSQEKDKQKNLVFSSTENEVQEYCNGLLQQNVDSSSATISTTYGDQKGSDNIRGKGSNPDFDLNKTPEQKAPQRRKHRPKVIVEAKPQRSSKPATRKTQMKENPRKKRKNAPKTAATPQTDVIEESVDSTVATKRSCRKALNFELQQSKYENQTRIGCQQEIHHTNEAFNTASDDKATTMLGGATITYGINSALLINSWEMLTVENQQPRNTDDNTLLHKTQTNNFQSERRSTTALLTTTEEPEIAKFPEDGPALGNSDMFQESNNGCMHQYIHAKKTDNILYQSEACFENSKKTREPIPQNTLQLVPSILSNSIVAKGSKRKYCKRTQKQHDLATNSFNSSFCQATLQADQSFKSATPAKDDIRKKIKNPQNRHNAKATARSSSEKMPKENPQKARTKDKNGFQSQSNEKMPGIWIESNRFIEQHNNGASTGECFSISEEPHQIYSTLIDEIICRLNDLKLGESNTSKMEGQKALVPYNGDRSVVPYQEFELVKKHKQRPKVELDAETERTWKLLMGKGGSEGLEGIDKEKEKWWEEERNVFHGRVDSFIARMHLFQGDRRFSKWKGSVVDSVIGVFLTQNVSDHLSSSAFMSLASRFPLQSKSSKKSYHVDTNTLLKEAELCIEDPADTITSYGFGILNQPTYHLGFETPNQARELWRDSEISRTKESLIKPNNQNSEEEFLSSQDSLHSSITKDARIGSSSGSNSESEGVDCRFEHTKTQFLTSNSLQIGKTTMFQEFYNSVNGVSLFKERNKDGQLNPAENVKQNCREGKNNDLNVCSAFSHPSNYAYPPKQLPVVLSTDYELYCSDTQRLETFQMNGEEFPWIETVSVHSEFQDNCIRSSNKKVGDSADKPPKIQHGNGTLGSPELPRFDPYIPLSKHLVPPQDASQFGSHTSYNQPLPNHHLVGQKYLESEIRAYTKSLNTSHTLGRDQDLAINSCNMPKHAEGLDIEKIISADSQGCSEHSMAESEPQKAVCSPNPFDKNSKIKVSKAKKAKTETEKQNASDWDKLRKEVQVNGIEKERSIDTMDSLDYEAVRCASVKEISKTIKERGMNNMLAERIKEFLNRLVTEHGCIDLEWLRHVPQDKAKDYLLSFQGLGLKSVECVRLLTLHHIAFPVDTNVGRIAVRLGWVPIQPLPEALQLHLLELYPVLESVQKYLWPRLCKLDQRTLYELHYQMITFGKVFCTKKKPNCNACPMRAECRHFASAFASARLALPGPQDKRIVSMHVPIAAERNYFVNKNPKVLPLLENNFSKQVSHESWHCEPIIEEPATPERKWTEAEESDMEDFYREDPDEILSIELNTKDSAINVKNHHLQEYMEHHEGDMSKALVTLPPQSASIPIPKLKNVSRLRTEHQVYELPDSHPLLENMDNREPDDPSPYLLAIWTPGETANSVDPPERRCGSRDSANLCNDNTCFSCNSIREANSQTVRGTLLIPCRTATRGSFPLNGTYFQVNELFADHVSSVQPIDIPREWIWNLPRRTVYFGTSVSSIFKGLSTQEIQHCFWRGFVCVRGFDQKERAPRPLQARLHFTASRLAKTGN
ncbi:hypothetical protein VNO78_19885 [Psophocarpus tetragonolobus]|uniref:HhH-GPD domain-containing protein n=1 Tax=Psophocarpus tetragonolobus TaxID=3891 RepID=A0AAN9S9X3_PSOTE